MIEKVNPAHPDKIADRIAGALVDYAYSVQSNHRIAVEVLVGHRVCHIIAETSAHIPATFVQDTVTRIAGEGVVMDYCEVDQDTHLAGQPGGGPALRRQRHIQGRTADRGTENAVRHRQEHLRKISL